MILKSIQTGQLQQSNIANCPVFTPVRNLDKILEVSSINDNVKIKPLSFDSGFLHLYLLKFLAGDKNTSSGFADCSVDELYLWDVARLGSNRFVKNVCSAFRRFALALDELSNLSKLTISKLTTINISLQPKISNCGIRNTPMRAGDPRINPYAFYCIAPDMVMEYMTNLVDFIHSDTVNDINKPLLVFQQFIFIHPFRDGNGRMSRLLFMKLMHDRYGFIYAAMLSIHLKNINRDNYYKAIYQYRNNNVNALRQFYNHAILWTNQSTKILSEFIQDYSQKVGLENINNNPNYSQVVIKSAPNNPIDENIFQFHRKKAGKNIYINTALLNVLNQFDYYLRYELRKHQTNLKLKIEND